MAHDHDIGPRDVTLAYTATATGGSTNIPVSKTVIVHYECNSDSTTILPPAADTVYSSSEDFIIEGETPDTLNDNSLRLERTYSFGVTNPSCPIESVLLHSPENSPFTVEYHNGGSYTVKLGAE